MNQKYPYICRVSSKAKRVRLQVTLEKGLEVIVPKWFSVSRVPALIEKNNRWIERAMEKAKDLRGVADPEPIWRMPEVITLQALDRSWSLLDCKKETKRIVLRETSLSTLLLTGPSDSARACQTALRLWLTQKAREHLVPWLNRVSRETGLSYSSVSIRHQRTRWGSCSSRHSISLNARLLFLPPRLVAYVLVHELCHTKHLNHSRRFWRLVESFLPDYRQSDRQLRDCGRCVPGWLNANCVSMDGP